MTKKLAQFIRNGLAHEGVKEDRLIWGACIVSNRVHANVIGLALIGKMGAVEQACQLFEKAFEESLGRADLTESDTKKVMQELGTLT